MNLINEEELKIIEDSYDYTKFKDKTALFETKIASDMRHNGEVIEVLGVIKGRNPEHDSYIVRFNDGTIEENVMNCELTFDYHRDKASIETRKELSRIMKLYELSDKEAEELLTASYNYDYEMNEGVVLTNLESIERLFTEEDSEERINPSIKQLKAMAMYIRETKEYYVPFFGYEEYTEKVIDLILNKDETEITKLEFLNEIKDMISHNIMCYSSNYSLEQSKQGYEKEFIRENKKLMLVEQMIKEEKQKEKKKNKEARLMEVKINKDIREFSESIFFGLSLRQFIFSVLACIVAVILYFILKPFCGIETLSWVCILGAVPFAVLGFVKYNGMTAEKFIVAVIKSEFLTPRKLTFKTTNIYAEIFKPTIDRKLKQSLLKPQKKMKEKKNKKKKKEVKNNENS